MIQGFNDIRDAVTQTAAITLGLIVGAVPVQAATVRRRQAAAMAGPPRARTGPGLP